MNFMPFFLCNFYDSRKISFMKNIIRRTTLKVRDIQKSYQFYTELLGMKPYYNNEVTVENDLLPGTKAGDKIHLIILNAQDPVIGMIGLLKPIDPQEEFPPLEFDFKYGSSVFVVGVDDVEELYQKALKFGAKMRAPLSETIYPGADGNDVHVKSLGLYDPDGHFMECNQRF